MKEIGKCVKIKGPILSTFTSFLFYFIEPSSFFGQTSGSYLTPRPTYLTRVPFGSSFLLSRMGIPNREMQMDFLLTKTCLFWTSLWSTGCICTLQSPTSIAERKESSYPSFQPEDIHWRCWLPYLTSILGFFAIKSWFWTGWLQLLYWIFCRKILCFPSYHEGVCEVDMCHKTR